MYTYIHIQCESMGHAGYWAIDTIKEAIVYTLMSLAQLKWCQFDRRSLCVCVCVCVCACVHVCVECAYGHTRIHICTCTYVHTYICTYTLAYRVQPTNSINHPVKCTHRRRWISAIQRRPGTNEIMSSNSDVL